MLLLFHTDDLLQNREDFKKREEEKERKKERKKEKKRPTVLKIRLSHRERK